MFASWPTRPGKLFPALKRYKDFKDIQYYKRSDSFTLSSGNRTPAGILKRLFFT